MKDDPTMDAHVDLPYLVRQSGPLDRTAPESGSFLNIKDGPFNPEEAKKANLSLFVMALYLEDRFNGPLSLAHFHHVLEHAKALSYGLMVPKEREDLLEEKGPMKTLFLVENADFLADDIKELYGFREEGILALGLTHCGANRLGEGDRVPKGEGLTRQGKAVLRAMDREGLLLDLAHLNERSFYMALESFKGPLLVSHTGIREVFDIQRNISIAQAKEIVQRGGVIGIGFNPEFLGLGKGPISERVYAHVDTVVQSLGPGHVCIGSDVCGFECETISYGETIKGLKDMMTQRGYGDEASAILGGNLLNFLKNSLP